LNFIELKNWKYKCRTPNRIITKSGWMAGGIVAKCRNEAVNRNELAK